MKNMADSQKYIDSRKKVEEEFDKPISIDSTYIRNSSSGNYILTISSYKIKEGCWNYTKGIVYDKDGKELFTIFRNYGRFPYQWVEHKNGNEYLLCVEYYQGYVILNLTQK